MFRIVFTIEPMGVHTYIPPKASAVPAGKRFSSVYETPYGPMGVEVFTDYVKNNFDMEKCQGSIDVQYQVSMEGLAEGINKITIKVM